MSQDDRQVLEDYDQAEKALIRHELEWRPPSDRTRRHGRHSERSNRFHPADGWLLTIIIGHLPIRLVVEEIDELAPDDLFTFTVEVTFVVGDEVSRNRTEIGTPDEEAVGGNQFIGQLGCDLGNVVPR